MVDTHLLDGAELPVGSGDLDEASEEGMSDVVPALFVAAHDPCRLCGGSTAGGRLGYCPTCLPDLFAG
jgi:hypothetical protein